MTPNLTDQQRQALHDAHDAAPVTVVDPATNAQYILVRVEVFEEMCQWMRELEPQEAYPMVDRIMAEDDASDPTLAGYQNDALPREPA